MGIIPVWIRFLRFGLRLSVRCLRISATNGLAPYFTLAFFALGLSSCATIHKISESILTPAQSVPAEADQALDQHNKAEVHAIQATGSREVSSKPTENENNNSNINKIPAITANWELPKLNSLSALTGHTSEVLGLFLPVQVESQGRAPSPLLLSVAKDGEVGLWDIASDRAYLLAKLDPEIDAIAYAPRTGQLAVARRNLIKIYSLSNGQVMFSLDRLQSRVSSLAFHPQEDSLLLGGYDGRVYRWRFVEEQKVVRHQDQEKILERYYGHASVVSAVSFHPYGRVFFSADWTGVLSAWLTNDSDPFAGKYDENLFEGRFFAEQSKRSNALRGDALSITGMLMSSDGQSLFTLVQDGRIEWWQVRGFKKIAEVQAHKGHIYAAALAPEGNKIASAGRDGKVKIFTLVPSPDGKVAAALTPEPEISQPFVSSLAFLPGGRLFLGESSGRISELQRP